MESKNLSNRITTIAYAIIAISCSLILRCLFINHTSMWPDEALYLNIARDLAHHPLMIQDFNGEFFYQNPPAFMYLLSILFRLIDVPSLSLVHGVIIGMDILLLIVSALIAYRLYGKWCALLTLVFLCVNPLHVWTSSRVLIDIPLTLFIYCAVLFCMLNQNALFYSFSVLSLCTKYPAAPLIILPLFKKDIHKKRLFICCLLLFILVPCFIFYKSKYTIPFPWLTSLLVFVKWPNWQELVKESFFFLDGVLIVLCIIGIVSSLIHKKFSPLLAWIIIFGSVRLFLPFTAFRQSRYTLPLYPGILILAAYGVVSIQTYIAKTYPNRQQFSMIILSAFVVYIVSIHTMKAYTVTDINSRTFIGYQDISNVLSSQTGPKTIISASPRQIKYYANEYKVFDIPKEITFSLFKELLQKKQISYFVIDRWSPHQPTWFYSFDFTTIGFEPIYGSKQILIYKVSK